MAEAHLALILAAFQCDIVRVATFQFSPASDYVCFRGLWPDDRTQVTQHYAVARRGNFFGETAHQDPALFSGTKRSEYDYLVNVQGWYNQRLATWLKELKATPDVLGGNLLDTTLVPYVTEVAEISGMRSPKPAFLFGGSKLGLKHGSFQSFATARPQADLYLTCAQALLQTANPLLRLSAESFVASNPTAAPIEGLWWG